MAYPISTSLTISAQFLYRAYLSCHALQARKPQLLDALQCSEPELRDPGFQLGDDAIASLCAATRDELNRTDIHSAIGKNMVPRCFSDLGFAAHFQPSFGEALLQLVEEQGLGGEKPTVKLLSLSSDDRLVWNHDRPVSPDLIHIVFSLIYHSGEVLSDGISPTRGPMVSGAYRKETYGTIRFPAISTGLPTISNIIRWRWQGRCRNIIRR